jgi:hypothetical protein
MPSRRDDGSQWCTSAEILDSKKRDWAAIPPRQSQLAIEPRPGPHVVIGNDELSQQMSTKAQELQSTDRSRCCLAKIAVTARIATVRGRES